MAKIREIFKRPVTEGEIGIEIEAEGIHLPRAVKGFNRVADGSLRGSSCEYVFASPRSRDDFMDSLDELGKAYHSAGTVLFETYRTSSHVHINMQEESMTTVYNMLMLYMMFEEYLVKYCGEYREGNLFCLRIRDAEASFHEIILAAQNQSWARAFRTDDLRYGAVNVKALSTYGSLEFRAMRGTKDLSCIVVWVKLLLALKDAAKRYENPIEIIHDISMEGSRGLAEKVFGDLLPELPLAGDWDKVVFQNMRELQDLAYCVDWGSMEKKISARVPDNRWKEMDVDDLVRIDPERLDQEDLLMFMEALEDHELDLDDLEIERDGWEDDGGAGI